MAQWKKSPGNKQLFQKLKGKVVIQSAWYASELTLALAAARGVDLSVEVPVDKILVAGTGTVNWSGKTTLKITGNDKVPFAIQGWEIK